jgi:hypothetical protein
MYLIFDQKYSSQAKYHISCWISGPYQIRYLAGYPVSGFWISRLSGRPDIRQKQYPVHPYKILLVFLTGNILKWTIQILRRDILFFHWFRFATLIRKAEKVRQKNITGTGTIKGCTGYGFCQIYGLPDIQYRYILYIYIYRWNCFHIL